MSILNRIVAHWREGTLIDRFRRRLGAPKKPAPTDTPVGDVYYGDCADDYLEKRLKQDYWHLEQEVAEKLILARPAGTRVLDVPFGTGRFVPFYLKQGMVVHGLDASSDMIRVAKTELKEQFDECSTMVGDAGKMPYKDGEFDLVVCFRFLSHIVSFNDAKIILRELHRVCCGEMLVQLRVRRDDAPKIDAPTDDQRMADRLGRPAIDQLLLDAGWAVKDVVDLEQRPTYGRAVFVCART